VLETAEIVTIDRNRPARIRLNLSGPGGED